MSAYPKTESKSKKIRPRPFLSRAAILYSLFGFLAFSNVLTLVGLVMAPEISSLFERTDEAAFAAYENRILQLRMEVDRLYSRQYRQDGDLNLQMQELTRQQEFLTEQHRYVRILAEKAAELGLDTGTMEIASSDEDDLPVMIMGALSASDAVPGNTVETISQSLDDMLGDSRLALTAIGDAAEKSADEILDGLDSVGIRLSLSAPDDSAVGGPFIPASGFDENSLAESANTVLEALDRFQQARDGLNAAPIHNPLPSRYRISSGFGNRRDPFGGASAFHSGIDFAAPSGTSVLAAGDGQVSFAGPRNGYGNLVEINHGGGIVSRYAHLSAILVRVGQQISTGDLIAKVGSTGRSTGPHLHFEVRRNDSAQNPSRYLELARTLRGYLL